MVKILLNGVEVSVEEGTSLLETAKIFGIDIPTLCYDEGLSSYGACRLCLVEVGPPGRSKLVTSCTSIAKEGMIVNTHTNRVIKTRKMLIELYVAACPSSKTIQDLASAHHITKVRFKAKNEDCILCGLCVRMCTEQMQGEAIGFLNRGSKRKIFTAFDKKSEKCRLCGGCMYICPACQARCHGPNEKEILCNGCINLEPPCSEKYGSLMCYLTPCVACELDTSKNKLSKTGKEK